MSSITDDASESETKTDAEADRYVSAADRYEWFPESAAVYGPPLLVILGTLLAWGTARADGIVVSITGLDTFQGLAATLLAIPVIVTAYYYRSEESDGFGEYDLASHRTLTAYGGGALITLLAVWYLVKVVLLGATAREAGISLSPAFGLFLSLFGGLWLIYETRAAILAGRIPPAEPLDTTVELDETGGRVYETSKMDPRSDEKPNSSAEAEEVDGGEEREPREDRDARQ